ncbi:hypothetical protein [Haliangium sp. UPWRP_2]|uniref:hypothetical protein n=1 Tax=Haliangium sp. UPWRP_2 TaxID=1931276 RepID=UPI0011B1DEC7|nr:hypothetical protein [Haliangium sp. UPWRP_2]
MSKRDTSRHSTEHDCPDCESNGTGIFALLEVLAQHDTDVITDEINREVIALCQSRGGLSGVRDAA